MFIGRTAELQFLENSYRASGGQLILLYGRRRVGKTETLKKFCEGKLHVYFACRECTDKLQLKAFSEQLLQEDIPARQYVEQFTDWDKAFRAVSQLPCGGHKKLLVLDEFPYLCKENPAILSILRNLWEEIWQHDNIMIVLCGSAISFVEQELLAEEKPLSGILTGSCQMKALNFYEASRFFPEYSELDKILAYAVLGGMPYYLGQFDAGLSLAENIKQNVLSKDCVLYREVDYMLRQELRETPIYHALLGALALGNVRLNDISRQSLVEDTSKTSVYLRTLIQMGIVEREFSLDVEIKEPAKTHRGIYKLTDPFFRFWYAFVYTQYSALEAGDVEGVYERAVRPFLRQFASGPFREVCGQYIEALQRANALPFRYRKAGRFFGRTTVRDMRKDSGLSIQGTEIDILAVSGRRKEYLAGACKLDDTPFTYEEYLDTAAKLTPQKDRSEFYYALFSAAGFEEKLNETAGRDGHVRLYSLKDIVNCRI